MENQPESRFSLDEIQQIIHLFIENNLQELELTRQDARLKLGILRSNSINSDNASTNVENPAQPKQMDIEYHAIRSPIAGTFYRCPNPESAAFVKQGSTILNGATLCILEAMKVMNEIKSEVNGRIVKIVPSDSQVVKKGDVLFLIDLV